MTKSEALRLLKAAGSAQTRKIYGNHGVVAPMYGVKFGDLNKIKRKIKQDQQLAEQLWQTGNHDARVLATMIADRSACKPALLDRWVKEANDHVIASALSGVAGDCPTRIKRFEKWSRARNEFVAATGWNTLAHILKEHPDDPALTDAYLTDCLKTIERTIDAAPNRTRYSMNTALIAIGVHNPKMEKKAIATARRIGPIEVDHGATGCKTADAEATIRKTLAHRKNKPKKKAG